MNHVSNLTRWSVFFCGLVVASCSGRTENSVPDAQAGFSTGGGAYQFENFSPEEIRTRNLLRQHALVKAKADLKVAVCYSLNFTNFLMDHGYQVARLSKAQVEAGQHMNFDILVLSRVSTLALSTTFVTQILNFLKEDKVLLTEWESSVLPFRQVSPTLTINMPNRLGIFDGLVGGGAPVADPSITIRLVVEDIPLTVNVAPVFRAQEVDYFLSVDPIDQALEIIATFEGTTSSGFENKTYPAIVKGSWGQSQIYTMLFDAQDSLNDPNISTLVLNAIEFMTTAHSQPPLAEAGPDQMISVHGQVASVVLDGSGSSDPEGDLLDYLWVWRAESETKVCSEKICTVQVPVGLTTFSLNVSDGNSVASDQMTVSVNTANQPPVALAGLDQNLDESNSIGAMIHLDGTGSYDPDGDSLTFQWLEGEQLLGTNPVLDLERMPGSYQFKLAVSDGSEVSTDDVIVMIRDRNEAPVLVCDLPERLEQESMNGSELILDASQSYDPEGLEVTAEWNVLTPNGTVRIYGLVTKVLLPSGANQIALVLSDGVLSALRTFDVFVGDSTPPSIVVSLKPDKLPYARMKYVRVRYTTAALDSIDLTPTVWLDSVTSNSEDLEVCDRGHGKKKICRLWAGIIVRDGELFLFAGDLGRTYTLVFKAADASGNTSVLEKTISVER